MPSVELKPKESFEMGLRRFKRLCEKAGVIIECKKREFYEKPTWIRKQQIDAAVKRTRKRMFRDMVQKKRYY